jgi:hypothetical protein
VNDPIKNGENGRDTGGRFSRGCKAGPGRRRRTNAAELRKAMLDAISPDDVRVMIEALVSRARHGNLQVIRELLDRVCGKPIQAEPDAQLEPKGRLIVMVGDGRRDELTGTSPIAPSCRTPGTNKYLVRTQSRK